MGRLGLCRYQKNVKNAQVQIGHKRKKNTDLTDE